MKPTFYWHDYETWGSNPRRDRPCQFAGQRTDEDLNPIGEPLQVFCRPPVDLLPYPEACLVTGLTPQHAARHGLCEAEFAKLIYDELKRPGTCGVGYNSLRFDDEVTRHLFYRNLRDPYAREWGEGRTRWDLIDTLRLAHALRPEGLEWPVKEDGTPSFRLEDLTAANGLPHQGAHDALADVQATIALARRLREAQPRLFAHALTLRYKRAVEDRLAQGEPMLHVSAKYPARLGCLAPVLPVADHPDYQHEVICWDLRQNPEPLFELSVAEIQARIFTRAEDRPAGVERLPLKGIRCNRSPMVAPLSTLTPEAGSRWAIDLAAVARHARLLQAASGLAEKIQEVYRQSPSEHADQNASESDPDDQLYSGGFFRSADSKKMARLVNMTPGELAQARFRFQDSRLPLLLWRYRARNWPESLSAAERATWETERRERLVSGAGTLTLKEYRERLAGLRTPPGEEDSCRTLRRALVDTLEDWAEELLPGESPL